MRISRVGLLFLVLGCGAWTCGGSNTPSGTGAGGNGAPAAQPAAMCDGGSACTSGHGEGDEGDMGDDTGDEDGNGADGGMHKADGGHTHADGGDENDDGND